jgi:hypothetical protein
VRTSLPPFPLTCVRVSGPAASSGADFLPLPAAAALTFRRTCRIGEDRLAGTEYAGALDIAAAALSRLVPIYTLDGGGMPVAVAVDLARQRFQGGAREVLRGDGTVLSPLGVARGDLPRALATIGRLRVEYLAPGRPQVPPA